MSSQVEAEFVDNQQALARVAEQLASAEQVGLDTEFHPERRYRPELLLVQLAIPGGPAWMIDPLAVDLHPLGEAMAHVTWVTHGAENDISLLHRSAGVRPSRLLDTQILAAMAGWDYPAPLGDLATDLLGRELDKSVSMTNWSARPLSPRQTRYAMEDAVVVLELLQALQNRGIDPVRRRWALAAGQELVESALTPRDPNASWLRMGLASRLDETTRRALGALYAWRERRAVERNVPPSYTLTDAVALDLARRRPTSIAQMQENRRMPSGLVKRHGQDLLSVIEQASASTDPPPQAPSASQRRVAAALRCWAQAMEPTTRVAASIALPGGLTVALARDGIAALNGWRMEAFGKALSAFLQGKTRLSLAEGRLSVVAR